MSEVTIAGLTLHTLLQTRSEALTTQAQHQRFIAELKGRGWVAIGPSECALPTTRVQERVPPITTPEEVPAARSQVRILVVDDEPSNLALAERVLVPAGYAVTTARDAEEALALIQRSTPFHLFVLDVVMPGMQGTDLAACIRLLDPDAKVLFFTAHSARLFRQTRILDDNAAFLQKPVGIRELAEAVSHILFGHLRGPTGEP